MTKITEAQPLPSTFQVMGDDVTRRVWMGLLGLGMTAIAVPLPAYRKDADYPEPTGFIDPAEPGVTPEMFGAVGDGRTDDTAAFQALSANVNARGKARIVLRPGATYIAGHQARNGAFYLFGGYTLFLKDCSWVVIEGNGATIKVPDGMKYGAFDARTGRPLPTKAPYSDPAGATYADVGTSLYVWNVAHFRITGGLTLDGNVGALEVGGEVGDMGRQTAADGAFIRDCGDVHCTGLRAVRQGRDGILVAQYGLREGAPARPHVFIDAETNEVGRNGVSVIGGNAVLFVDGRFINSGQVRNKRLTFGTAPGSGVDVEAEGGVCRNIRFRNCHFGKATGNAFVADTGDTRHITFDGCRLDGIVWTTKPFTQFYRCTINGVVRRAIGATRKVDGGTSFDDCILNGVRRGDLLIDTIGSGGMDFRRCHFTLFAGRVILRSSILDNCTIDVRVGTEELKDRDWVAYLEGATVTNLIVTSHIPVPRAPKLGYYIAVATNGVFTRGSATTSGKIFWGSGEPAFQGKLWQGSTTVVARTLAPGGAASIDVILPFAQPGDLAHGRYSEATPGLGFSWKASDNKVTSTVRNVTRRPIILPAGTASARVEKRAQ